ncbi:MAG TPA: CCA tRNA nucleotidyltransferase [Bosea sp. (in: a-proteobacteria)]|jgi:poly(A) polymerase|uniref:CCA tRNA nucleotidyltransferase n=1 Tax=Bosea sp. (in: a-proteobacteria) TaxID=1871050 RepID=UPI002E12BA99|nr:CCA tRNA nucleotidyltransferase [Bosea sp. (in: a-proteobacteria)]
MSASQARIADFLARPALASALDALNGEGEETRVVGGAVRDLLLGEPVGDVDLATTALPQETIRRGKAAGFKAVPTGIEHGTVTLVREGTGFEVTTLREDVETHGRRATVKFGRDFVADALRRDFTVNALSLGRDGTIHDHCGGLADLAERRIRFIGDAGTRIREDYLRILRFFRFHARFGLGAPDGEGLTACIAGRAGLGDLSRERVRAELMKLLIAPGAVAVIETMAASGLLMPVIGGVPYLSRFAAVASDGDAGLVYPAFRLAALTVSVREDALRLREGLRLSNEEFDRIERIAGALELLAGRASPPNIALLRHLAHRIGDDAVAAGLVLLAAPADEAGARRTQDLIAALGRTPPFLPSGRDVIALGVPAGPRVGLVLDAARRDWIEAAVPADRAAQMAFVARAVAALPGEP